MGKKVRPAFAMRFAACRGASRGEAKAAQISPAFASRPRGPRRTI